MKSLHFVFGPRLPDMHSSCFLRHERPDCAVESCNNALCPPHRACLGQCFSYSVPNTFPQSTESLVHCDSCMPAQTQWEVVRFMAH